MSLYDLTQTLSPELPVWPGDPPVVLTALASLSGGDDCNLSALSLSAHGGTHVDAPRHYLADGVGADQLPLSALVGPAWLAAAPARGDTLDAAALAALDLPPGTRRLLLRTRLADSPEHWAGLSIDAANWLVARGVILVGVDGPSVAPLGELVAPHRVLLAAGVVVVENLLLAGVPAGGWQLACLPLKLAGADGAPARVVVWRDEE